MNLHNLEGREPTGYTTWGCIWEQGACDKRTAYRLADDKGNPVPVQTRVTAWWPDGSVKWTAHTADAGKMSETVTIVQDDMKAEVIGATIEQGDIVETEILTMEIPAAGSPYLFQNVCIGGKIVIEHAEAILLLEEPFVFDGQSAIKQKSYQSELKKVEFLEQGPLQWVVRYEGCHKGRAGDEKFPFTIFMKVYRDSCKIDFVHTFFYNGAEDYDYLKGLGIRTKIPMQGPMYNRHVKMQGEHGCFHESAAQLLGGKGLPWSVYEAQMQGQKLKLTGDNLLAATKMLPEIPLWSEFTLCQDSVSHFSIRKKVGEDNCCYIKCLDGGRTDGCASIGSENGAVLFGLRDFWERYPSGYTFQGMDQDAVTATLWLWSPGANAMDFRHYANRGYERYYYEGYRFKGATPYGIGCTSEFSLSFTEHMIPSDKELTDFSRQVKYPPMYVGEPEYYHDKKAFGRWSLRQEESECQVWLEEQLNQAVDFYINEVRQRNWYGMFDYGDFMHTYDPYRHQWRYDMGGFAWDNTELVPTMWLWLMFLRSGRSDVFSLAEKLTRHTSEVDVYHLGEYKGLGSRHNVRHWGCPCKEVRVSMAGHHRYYYYLTGDYRLGEMFEEMKDSEKSLLIKDPLEAFYTQKPKPFKAYIRTGPDWSSLCGDWMTRWERYNDECYKDKIVTGIADIKKAPLALISGPDFGFDPESFHLYYIGEQATGGTHLQICMGAPQIWLELAELLDDKDWIRMLADYGRFYYLDPAQQQQESDGIIGNKEFSLPYMAGAMGAFSAAYFKDQKLARRTWEILFDAISHDKSMAGFSPTMIDDCANQQHFMEIPWISTNFTAQWCLNVIMALEFIRADLPDNKEWSGNE